MATFSDADMNATADAIAHLGTGDLLDLLKPPLVGLRTLLSRAARSPALKQRIANAKLIRKRRLTQVAEHRYADALRQMLPLIRNGATVQDACTRRHSTGTGIAISSMKQALSTLCGISQHSSKRSPKPVVAGSSPAAPASTICQIHKPLRGAG